MGWETLKAELLVVIKQVDAVKASMTDDDTDEFGPVGRGAPDGVAYVGQHSATELLQRKTVVAMSAITDPKRLQV